MSKRKYLEYKEKEESQRLVRNKHHSKNHKDSRFRYPGPADCIHEQELTEFSNRILDGDSCELRSDKETTGKGGSGECSLKIARLLDALEEVLLLDPKDIERSLGDFDKDALSQCKTLRRSLRNGGFTPTSTAAATSTLKAVQTAQNLPQVPPLSSLTPWTSSSILSDLPMLPVIKSPALKTAAFTHSGMTSNAGALSYERLEWVGDAYLYLISTLLISSTFTSYLPGKCSQIRELLVKNETLASFARQYGFEKQARLPPEFSDNPLKGVKAKQIEKTKVMGDIFEAYVAAIVLSDPENGVESVSSWVKNLWAQTISTQIVEQERLNKRAKFKADDDIDANFNPKDRLTRKIGAKGVHLTYRAVGPETKDLTTGFPLFTVGVYLDGWGEHDKQLGIGKAQSKKDAGMKAAEMALANKKLMALYVEMKRVHDEKLLAEKEKRVLGAEGSHQK